MVPDRTFQSISSAASRVLPLADLRHLSSGTSSSRLADFDCVLSISPCPKQMHASCTSQNKSPASRLPVQPLATNGQVQLAANHEITKRQLHPHILSYGTSNYEMYTQGSLFLSLYNRMRTLRLVTSPTTATSSLGKTKNETEEENTKATRSGVHHVHLVQGSQAGAAAAACNATGEREERKTRGKRPNTS